MDRKDFAAYKRALKEKYEEEKSGRHAPFLIAPTSAKLRDLCIQMLQHENNSRDRQSFLNFFRFEFDPSNLQKIKNDTEKFRPLATFLKGGTEIGDNNFLAADMLAILLNFEDRPYSNFRNSHTTNEEVATTENDSGSISKLKIVDTGTLHDDTKPRGSEMRSSMQYIQIVIADILILGAIVLTGKHFVSRQSQCLTWNSDHYETVDCQGDSPIKPYDKNLLNFRKIAVSDTTTFFVDERPVVWYSKQDNQLEYFNSRGEHPVTGKTLRPITRTIIQNHILSH